MSTKKKQSFLGGAAILASAVAIVKGIGFFYKIPLNNILGEEGKTYFDSAYQIYNVLLSISTAGLPLALSKLVSEAQARGRENEKRKLFSTAIWIFFALGLAGFAIMFFGTSWVAARLHNESAYWAIRALSPAVFCVCLLACMRGYTQGQGNMTPTAVSQVLEALSKLGIGLALAWYIFQAGMGQKFVAAGAILGVTIGTVLSMLFLIGYLLTHRSRAETLDVPESRGTLARHILVIGVPITLSNSAMSIITLVDTSIVLGRLQNGLGLTEEAASALKGAYGYAMDMVNLPPSFVFPVTMSLIPVAAAPPGGRPDHLLRLPPHRHPGPALRRGAQRAVYPHHAPGASGPAGGRPGGGTSSAGFGLCLYLHLRHEPHQRHFADLRQGTHTHLHRRGRRRGQNRDELYPGGHPGDQHPRRAHFNALLLCCHRPFEPVLRLEILPHETQVFPALL